MAAQIKFHQLRAFVAVTRHGSIRSASRQLNISQPALTKAIKELEESVATQLFTRRSHGMSLTEAGESFFQHASLILEELRAAQEDLQQRQGCVSGQVNIGIGTSISRSVMPEVIKRFHRQYPGVRVRIMEGQLVNMLHELRQGELDFTINTYYQSPYDHELTFEKLMAKRYAVFARKGHPASEISRLDELMDWEWTMPTPRGSYYRQLHELFASRGLAPNVSVVCETFTACSSLVAHSDFLSILPAALADDAGLAPLLQRLPLDESLPLATFYLIQRRDTTPAPITSALMQLFRLICHSEPA
ncbi:transcriptional regulator [Mangrovibacter sp. MFB070]|uniref:LysR family transcriptional regulator n=1 Tax=Mangrovibacter sp. MFB070 TaxID=1224318 RepID=UPI0004D94ACC|nr:LysR family transcriptional regulator [Mangrovibacter sp. MFB070]KEA50550.1 transcriptional regulator [Mangrovibacter sp. MFB070]